MTSMLYTSLLALTSLLTVGPLPNPVAPSAGISQADSSTLAADSAHVMVRRPPDTLLAQFRSDPAFNYETSPGWTWWQDVKRWVRAQLAQLFGSGTAGEHTLRIALYLLLALLVGYAAYMLVRLRSSARSPGRTAPETVAHPQTAEEMQAIDFDARLATAVDDGHYRRAVRLLYQQALQRLDQAGAIAWRPGKTNRTYVIEVDAHLRPAFDSLTRLFERVWYGGASVDAERFAEVRAQFDSFWEKVHGESEGDASAVVPVSRDTSTTDRPAA
jgi:hypothetical protein